MVGTQFSFFLGTGDQAAFEDAVRGAGDVAFLKVWPSSTVPEELPDSQVRRMGMEILDILISRRADLQQVEFKPVQGRNVFSCSTSYAPVIEFSRCYVASRFIRAGRLYRIDRYWNDSQQQEAKPKEFIEWANRLYKLAKASLTRVEQGCYAGLEAIELRRKGIAFEGLDIEVGSVEN